MLRSVVGNKVSIWFNCFKTCSLQKQQFQTAINENVTFKNEIQYLIESVKECILKKNPSKIVRFLKHTPCLLRDNMDFSTSYSPKFFLNTFLNRT